IACRTADWPISFEDSLKGIWGVRHIAVYQMAPLRRKDVALAAEANEIAPNSFLKVLEQREAVPLAIKPITLAFLMNCYKRDGRFPATKAGLYLEGCLNLCEESERRRDAGFSGTLNADERLRVAARIAALTVYGGFSAIWTGI